MILATIFWAIVANAGSVIALQSGPCGSPAQTIHSTAVPVRAEGNDYLLASDLGVWPAPNACHEANFQNVRVALDLVRLDSRRGLALLKARTPTGWEAFPLATVKERRPRVLLPNSSVSAELLQSRSARSFFPAGQFVMESKADLSASALGAPVVNRAGEWLGLVSRYQLVFEIGRVTKVARIEAHENYAAPLLLPAADALAWAKDSLSSSEESARWMPGEAYQIKSGNILLSETCDQRALPPGGREPIGGIDGFGIGGFDIYAVGGLNRAASVCEITLRVAPGVVPAWARDLPRGKKLSLLGMRTLHPLANAWILVSAFSLDHFLKVMEDSKAEAFFRAPQTPENGAAQSFARDLAAAYDPSHESARFAIESEPNKLYVLNQMRLFNLLLLSDRWRTLPKAQWDELLKPDQRLREDFTDLFPGFTSYQQKFERIWSER